MKKIRHILLLFFLLLTPSLIYANLEFYFEDGSIFREEVISSAEYRWSKLLIRTNPRLNPVPKEYDIVETITTELIELLIQTHLEEDIQEIDITQLSEDYYELYTWINDSALMQYLDIAISQEVEEIIRFKIDNDIVLTPYEEQLHTSHFSLSERQQKFLKILSELHENELQWTSKVLEDYPDFFINILPYVENISTEFAYEVSEDIVRYAFDEIRNNDSEFDDVQRRDLLKWYLKSLDSDQQVHNWAHTKRWMFFIDLKMILILWGGLFFIAGILYFLFRQKVWK